MTRILMVCLGNICRSPLAEGILRKRIDEAGLTNVEVDSAGTSGWHEGEHPDHRSVHNARRHDVDISTLVSRKFSVADFERFDRIYVMDSSNYRDVTALAKNEIHLAKVDFLLNCKWPGKNMAVPDPYYSGAEGFETVFHLVNEACLALVGSLQKENAGD
ncbi:MAG TPA: low molecular weight protein-tyrosine-phosphatase [Bacteroidia bacterium]|nr:low molecular weight protein-tyrosine-phosphatase [Bacteroidia bacterium]